jgi:hypothetical protein
VPPSIDGVKTVHNAIDVEELMREIARYLEVVEAFRAAGCDVGGLGRRKGGAA